MRFPEKKPNLPDKVPGKLKIRWIRPDFRLTSIIPFLLSCRKFRVID
jgi:hypothetical protein